MIIEEYFPNLNEEQKRKFLLMPSLYKDWNEKINVVSRKDIDNIELHHILHSLAIAKLIRFSPGSRILDLGTGGGFPGIPLAVLMPDVKFHLIDRIGKKIKVAQGVAEELGLENVTFQHGDSGECHEKFDFVVSRAVMPQPDLVKAIKGNVDKKQRNALPNGLISLKGGELENELKGLKQSEIIPVSQYFDEDFFKTKKIVYTPI